MARLICTVCRADVTVDPTYKVVRCPYCTYVGTAALISIDVDVDTELLDIIGQGI